MIDEIYSILNNEDILKLSKNGIHYINYDLDNPPFIIFNIYKIKPIYYADNIYNYKKYYIQIELYNKQLKALNELEKLVITNFNSKKYILDDIQDLYDNDLKCYKKIIRYTKINKN